jgi:hypothetical protein
MLQVLCAERATCCMPSASRYVRVIAASSYATSSSTRRSAPGTATRHSRVPQGAPAMVGSPTAREAEMLLAQVEASPKRRPRRSQMSAAGRSMVVLVLIRIPSASVVRGAESIPR